MNQTEDQRGASSGDAEGAGGPVASSGAASDPAGRTAAGAAEPPVTFGAVFKKLGPAGPLAVAWSIFPPLGSILLFAYISTVGAWLRGHEGTGIAIYIAAFAVLAGVALLPTYASAILGGWAFGFAEGFPAALGGFCGGAIIGYFIARGAAKDRAVKLIEEHEKWRIVKEALVGGGVDDGALVGKPPVAQKEARRHGFWKMLGMVALVRMPPSSPFAMTNLVMASVKVRFVPFVLGTLIGMAPRTGVAVYIAAAMRATATDAEGAVKKPWWWIVTGIVLGIGVLGILGVIAKKALLKAAGKGRATPAASGIPER